MFSGGFAVIGRPRNIRFWQPRLESVGREVFADDGGRGAAIAGVYAVGFAEEFFDDGEEG
jgi:hypothetical protein